MFMLRDNVVVGSTCDTNAGWIEVEVLLNRYPPCWSDGLIIQWSAESDVGAIRRSTLGSP